MHYEPPRPIALPQPSARFRARRLAQTLAVASKHLGPASARRLTGREEGAGGLARALRLTFEELGATYVKFGQIIASAPAIVGPDVAEEFRSCLDSGPPLPFATVRRIVERETGMALEQGFAAFERAPFAAASMAVVHRARLHDGSEVAVKVLRPGMARLVAADLDLMEPFFRALARQGIGQVIELVNYLVGLREQIREELDLRNEQRSMAYFRHLFARFRLDTLVIPRVHEALSTRRVLTMEYLHGSAIDDLAAVEAQGLDPKPLVDQLLQAWCLSALLAGVFHADIHAGNLLLLPDGRLGMLDWGIVARLDPGTYNVIRGMVSVALGNEQAWDEIVAFVTRMQGTVLQETLGLDEAQIARMVRAIVEPVLMRPLAEASMAALFASADDMMVAATGEPLARRTVRERWRANRAVAAANRLVMKNGYTTSQWRRQSFLTAKQLLYLERYGRMYMPERAVLGDTDFLASAWEQLERQGAPELLTPGDHVPFAGGSLRSRP